MCEPGAEALAGGAAEEDLDHPVGQAGGAVPARDLAREEAAHRAVLVLDRPLRPHAAPSSIASAAELQQVHVDRVPEHGLRRPHARARRVLRHGVRNLEQRAQVDAARLPVVDRLVGARRSVRPISSSTERTPSDAIRPRASSATMNR